MADMTITTFNCRFYDFLRMASDRIPPASNSTKANYGAETSNGYYGDH
jgi:hypothetical protein